MKIYFKFLILFFGFLLFFGYSPNPLSAQFEEEEEGPPKEVTYSFIASLSKAQALRIKRAGQVYKGKWTADRFHFEKLPGIADIFVSDNALVDAKPHSVIWFPSLSGFESSISFSKIPPGKRLYVFFALPDSVFKQKKVVPVDFEISIGEKKLLNTRILAQGVREEVFDLTLPYLLHRPYRVTFRIRSADSQPVDFVLHGYIE